MNNNEEKDFRPEPYKMKPINVNRIFTWTKDGISCPKWEYTQRFDDPELRSDMSNQFSERRKCMIQRFRENYEDKTLKEIWGEIKETRCVGFRRFDPNFNQQLRYWSVFGLTFYSLLKTRHILPTVFAFGLTSYFICPEIIFGKNDEKGSDKN